MLTVADAQQAILRECRPLAAAPQPLNALLGRVLAESIRSPLDSPPFDKSMMDGYAVRSSDLRGRTATLRILGELTAGTASDLKVLPGTAARIMTGAPIPAGADAVVRLEETIARGAQVEIQPGSFAPGLNIIRRGQMLNRGETVLSAGRCMRPQELALLAELGRADALVHRQPTAAVLATGDELVSPGQPLGPGQICNSNETLLRAQLTIFGANTTGLGIARDRHDELREKISTGLTHDVLILTGGVSMGTRDLVPGVLTELGVRQVFHKVQLKPGKPIWFGVHSSSDDCAPGTLIFALPGNPVSSMVCSELFVRPAVAGLAGWTSPIPATITAVLTRGHRLHEDRPTYYPARLKFDEQRASVTPTAWQGSADLRSTADANALIVFPPGERTYATEELVNVWPLCDTIAAVAN